MLLDYGQLGTPQPVEVDLSKWITNFWDEKKRHSSMQEIFLKLEGPLPPVRCDDRHLNFVFERIFEEIQSKGIGGKDVRIVRQGATHGENWENVDIWYDEKKDLFQPPSRKIASPENRDFEGLSLELGLARRIMRKNDGEMGMIQEEGGKTRIFLQFRGQTSG
jgi:hypothetical protein